MHKTLIILGNGKSLANVDLTTLNKYDTFGLNNAHIRFEELNWFPTYYGVFQLAESKMDIPKVISFIKSHSYKFKKTFYYGKDLLMPIGLMNPSYKRITFINLMYSQDLNVSFNGDRFEFPFELELLSITETMLNKKEKEAFNIFLEFSSKEELQALYFLNKTGIVRSFKNEPLDDSCYLKKPRYDLNWTVPSSYEKFNFFGGNSGIIATWIGYLLGYKKIILLGVDCNFTAVNDILDTSQSYWFENYFPSDYNIKEYCPICTQESLRDQQIHSWNILKDTIEAKDLELDIVNCTPNSNLTCFRSSTLENEL